MMNNDDYDCDHDIGPTPWLWWSHLVICRAVHNILELQRGFRHLIILFSETFIEL